MEPNTDALFADELLEVRIRYKNPGESRSNLITLPVKLENIGTRGSSDFDFACCVAAFSELLRDSRYAETVSAARIASVAEYNLGKDSGGYREDFLTLLKQYHRIAG